MAVLSSRDAIQAAHGLLRSRQTDGTNDGKPKTMSTGLMAFLIAAASILVLIIIIVLWWVMRRKSSKRPITKESKSIFSRFRSGSNRGEYSAQLQPNDSTQADGASLSQSRSEESRTRDVEMELVRDGANSSRNNNSRNNNESGVDRHTSVRSIMTLPPYSVSARPTEQVLGREGDRGGIDLVVEQPETLDEEEERREEEMDSLYQIRRARRQEAAEREERRRARREARARGDTEALNRMQRESRQRAQEQSEGTTVSAQLIAEHQTRNRERRVSSVQYQSVGVARHDGSRVRNTSIDSDNRPLLSSAASISGNASGSRPNLNLQQHGRDRSTTSFQSVSSIDSNMSDEAGSRIGQDFEIISLETGRTRSHSSAGPSGNEETAPQEPPPNYEDAPPYESPVTRTAPQLPRLTHLPSIRVSPTLSPIPSPRE